MGKENGKIENTALFLPRGSRKLIQVGVGYHNVDHVIGTPNRTGVSDNPEIEKAKRFYADRCGHVPLTGVNRTYVLVGEHTEGVNSQMQYLSSVYGRTIEPKTSGEIRHISQRSGERPLLVPYINRSITQEILERTLQADVWGLPPVMVEKLKNKADFHTLVNRYQVNGITVPDYTIVPVDSLAAEGKAFFEKQVDGLYRKYGMDNYRRGLMMRGAESDGNYGAVALLESDAQIVMIPNGHNRKNNVPKFGTWEEATKASQDYLSDMLSKQGDRRVVVSRFMDTLDSPGMSLAIIDGEVASLGWNGQLQKSGSTACVGTRAYKPENRYLEAIQEHYQAQIAEAFTEFLKRVAEEQNVDLRKVRGFINLDFMVPGFSERKLQEKRFGKMRLDAAEINPRWTNWTDALSAAVAVSDKEQQLSSFRSVIEGGIENEDKFEIPESVDPRDLRDAVYLLDQQLKEHGRRIIVRMPKSPTGLIFMGKDIAGTRRIMQDLTQKLAAKK